ncbi:MAG: hypothetical protein LJF04_06760 [Gemmatimonadetes bacterium]|nr:hypothetical protein [Gemmatimonadota bacterium]
MSVTDSPASTWVDDGDRLTDATGLGVGLSGARPVELSPHADAKMARAMPRRVAA